MARRLPLQSASLAVIAAMEPEASLVRRRLRPCRQQIILEIGRLWRGQVGAHRVVLLRCGMGAERVAIALQWLVEHERLWGVLSLGFAGGLQSGLSTGDVVLADRIQAWPGFAMPQEAVSASTISEGHVVEGAVVTPNSRLASLAAIAAKQAGLSRHQGLLLSHHLLVSDTLDKRLLGLHTGALAVDMESYWIGSLAAIHRLPFLSMRAILDPYDTALDFPIHGLTTTDGGILPGGAALAVMRQPALLKSFWALWRLARVTQRQLAVWLDHFFTLLDTTFSEEDSQKP
jgi:adenosylhomocysteine nucleosidase